MPENIHSPEKKTSRNNPRPVSKTTIIIRNPSEKKLWHDTTSIPFDTYLERIKSLKKSDFE